MVIFFPRSAAVEVCVYRFNLRGNYHIAMSEGTDFLKTDDPTADLVRAGRERKMSSTATKSATQTGVLTRNQGCNK